MRDLQPLVERVEERTFIALVLQWIVWTSFSSPKVFEELSWKQRCGVARASVERIRKILLGHHVLSLSTASSSLLPSTCYVAGGGWSQQGYARMPGMCMRQLRLIARSPMHLTEEYFLLADFSFSTILNSR